MTGLLGWGDAYKAMHESDMIVLWGTDFPYFNFIPTKPKIVQIDRRGEVLGRRSRLDLGICGDVSVTAEALLNMVQEKTDSEHLEASLKRHAKDVKDMNAYMEGNDKESPIRPEQLTTALNKYAASDAVFTVDTGTPCIWSARFLCATMGRSMIASFNHGSMANAMPMAMAAQKEYPDRQVIALCGDGGLSMLLGDLITIAQYKLPVKIVVYNNGCLDFIQLEMQAAGPDSVANRPAQPVFFRRGGRRGHQGVPAGQVQPGGPDGTDVPELSGAGPAGRPCGPGCPGSPALYQRGTGRGFLPFHDEADFHRRDQAGLEYAGGQQEAVQAVMCCGQWADAGD